MDSVHVETLQATGVAMDSIHIKHKALTSCNLQRRNHFITMSQIACGSMPNVNPLAQSIRGVYLHGSVLTRRVLGH